jgi:hypothetical protein
VFNGPVDVNKARTKIKNSRKIKMVLHNHKRLWTPLERRNNYEYGLIYCARFGFERFKKMELECWEICAMQFDDEEVWLSRHDNPRPLTRKDRDRRRVLLHALGNQLTRYLAVTKENYRKMKNTAAKENPITIN